MLWEAMFIIALLNKTAVFAETLSQWTDGLSHIQQLTGTRETIYHIIRGTVVEIVYIIGLILVCKVFLALSPISQVLHKALRQKTVHPFKGNWT